MDRSMTSVATVFVATVLCLCMLSIDADADGKDGAIGMSYRSHSPSGDYGMDVRYHDDGRMWFAVTDTDGYASGIPEAVAITISDTDGDVQKHLYPLRIMGQQWVDFGTPILPDGDYVVRIDDSSGTSIVESGLWVGGMGTVTVRGPGDGSDLSLDVPHGSVMMSSGDTLTLSFATGAGEHQLGSFTASVPQGSVFCGWSVDGVTLFDGSGMTVSDDVSITYGWTAWVGPTPMPDPRPIPIPEDDGSVTVGYDGDMLTNPITIRPRDPNAVTSDQSAIARGYLERIVENGLDPQVVVIVGEGPVRVPSDLLGAIIDGDGTLIVMMGDVTLSFDTTVLDEIGHTDDLEFAVTCVTADVSEYPGIDHAVVYDIYVSRNGERVTDTLSSPISVSIGYPSDRQSDDRIHVYRIDAEPYGELDMTYRDGTVGFSVHRLSNYAIVCDGDPVHDIARIWYILVALVSLCSMIVVRYLRSG